MSEDEKGLDTKNKNKQSFSDSITTTLKEAEFDLDKGQAKIVIIEEGWSSNNFYYSKDRLIEMKDLLEDRRKMYANHESSLPNFGSRNIFEWACTIKEVFLEGNKLKAVIDFTDNPYTNWLKDEAKKHPEEIQFSINAEGFTHAGEIDDREGNIVDKMSVVNSVDLVSYGAAGGRLEDIKESLNKLKKNEKDLLKESNEIDSIFNKVKEVENLFSELMEEQRKNDTKEVDIMKLSELKSEYSDLMEEYRNEIESELKEELDKSKKLAEKDEEIESLNEEIEDLKESKKELEESKDKLSDEVNKYQMKEKANKRKSFVSGLLKESNLNISLDNMPKDFKESVLNLDRDEEEVKDSIEDLIDFVSNDNLVEDAGETAPSEEDEEEDEVDLTEDDKKALEALTG